jgi:hypothetical protein
MNWRKKIALYEDAPWMMREASQALDKAEMYLNSGTFVSAAAWMEVYNVCMTAVLGHIKYATK